MMRSMFSGVSGLKAHQTRMDVIGNNVANVNTVGFKSGRVTFQEIFSQTLRGAGAPDTTTGRGGTNPMQVGLGLGVGAVDTIMTRGSVQRTDNPTDLSIEGEGFFIVKGGSADTFKFTRAGNFGLDKQGNLVTGSGMNVYGWHDYDLETGEFKTENEMVPLNIYSGGPIQNKRIIPPAASTKMTVSGNLYSGAMSRVDYNTATNSSEVVPTTVAAAKTLMQKIEDEQEGSTFKVPITVYDKLGEAHTVDLSFIKDGNFVDTAPDPDENRSRWLVFADGDISTDPIGEVIFDQNGKFYSTDYTQITVQPSNTGTDAFTVDIDLSGLTCYANDNSASATADGYYAGNLVTFNIGSDGILTGIYSNGKQQPLGLIALAGFENPAGLQKVGDNLYIPTTNSGDFEGKGVKAGSGGVGTLSPGTLEMSNVDLSREFTDMIVTQRGFQANSRIITTSDEMLQELVSLKR